MGDRGEPLARRCGIGAGSHRHGIAAEDAASENHGSSMLQCEAVVGMAAAFKTIVIHVRQDDERGCAAVLA
jgi:hypothetical protein